MGLSTNEESKKRQLANLKPRKKGDPPIPGCGHPRKLPITEELRKLFDDPNFAREYARNAAMHAWRGSSTHFKEINDRVEGTTKQVHELTGADGGPVEHTIRFGITDDDEKPPDE